MSQQRDVPVGTFYGGWFSHAVMGRVNTENNCLIICEGEIALNRCDAILDQARVA